MTSAPEAPILKHFPVALAVWRTYAVFFADVRDFLMIASPRAAPAVLALFLLSMLSLQRPSAATYWALQAMLIGLAKLACLLIAAALIAVVWHRRIMAETHASRSIGSVMLNYTLRALALTTIVLTLPQTAFTFAYSSTFNLQVGWLAFVFSLPVSGLLAARLSVTFPAVAVGARTTFRDSWRLTRGNSLRVFAAATLTVAPAYILMSLAANPVVRAAGFSDVTSALASSILSAAKWMLTATLFATFSSLAYRFFVDGRLNLEGGKLETLRETFS